MNFTNRHLRAFLALTESRSFTRAAENVCLSQPAFSALINALEQEVGFKLFNRGTRHVELTVDGEHFIEIAQRLVKTYDDSVIEIKERGSGWSGKVSIAALPSIAVCWLPKLLLEYQERHPKVKIELLDVQWDRCLKSVLAGASDFALTACDMNSGYLTSEIVFSDEFYLVCHRDHPLAGKPEIAVEDLDGQRYIGFTRSTSIRQHIDRIVYPVKLDVVLEVEQLTTVMGMVAANFGVSIVAGLTLFMFRHQDIAIRPIWDIHLRRDIHMVKRKDRALSVAAQGFYEYLMESTDRASLFADLPAKSCSACE